MVRQTTLYKFNPLKFVKAYFVDHYMASVCKCSYLLEKNTYSSIAKSSVMHIFITSTVSIKSSTIF